MMGDEHSPQAELAAGFDADARRRWNRERSLIEDAAAAQAERSGQHDEADQEIIDAPNGDPRLRGTITAAVPIKLHFRQDSPALPPVGHPAWDDVLAVPTPGRGSDLLIASDLDDALRKAIR